MWNNNGKCLRRGVAKDFIQQPKFTKHFLTIDPDMDQQTSPVRALKEKHVLKGKQNPNPTQNWGRKGVLGQG